MNEARSHPESNPRLTNWEQLEKYSNDDDIYIHFAEIPLVKFNLATEYNTPLGVYCYPLREIWSQLQTDNIPFAGKRKYIAVLKRVSRKFYDVSKFTPSLYSNAVDSMLHQFYDIVSKGDSSDLQGLIDSGVGSDILSPFESEEFNVHNLKRYALPLLKSEQSIDKLGEVVYQLAITLSVLLNEWYDQIGAKDKSRAVIARELLVKAGIEGLSDKDSLGVIHINEPLQAVFFTPSAFKVLDLAMNDAQLKDRNSRKTAAKIDGYLKNGQINGLRFEHLNDEQKKRYLQIYINAPLRQYPQAEILDSLSGADLQKMLVNYIHRVGVYNERLLRMMTPETQMKLWKGKSLLDREEYNLIDKRAQELYAKKWGIPNFSY